MDLKLNRSIPLLVFWFCFIKWATGLQVLLGFGQSFGLKPGSRHGVKVWVVVGQVQHVHELAQKLSRHYPHITPKASGDFRD
jgi:hypothetical protein